MTPASRAQLVSQLIFHEALRLKPYTDTVGKLTIGVGRNLTDCGISEDEARAMLDHDIDAAIHDLAETYPWFAELDDVRQRVLVDMRFNLGATALATFHATLAAMARGDYYQASLHMLASKWASQVGQRAIRLSKMMRTGEVEI